MRNNTLIKLLAVLALCVLTCVAFVACTEEAPVETAQSVKAVAFDSEGNLVITYDDDTTQKVALPAAKGCTINHEEIEPYVLKNHTMKDGKVVNGVSLKVCNGCGWSNIVYEANHDMKDVPGSDKEANCLRDGTKDQKCTLCGFVDTVKVADKKTECNPDTAKAEYVAPDGAPADANICVNGGKLVYYCKDCGEVVEKLTYTAPDPKDEGFDNHHTVTEWKVTTKPTYTTAGEAKGVCTAKGCGVEVVRELDACNTDKYTEKLHTITNCGDEQKADYTLKVETKIVIKDVHVADGLKTHMLYNAEGKLVPVYANTEIDPETGKVYHYDYNKYFKVEKHNNDPENYGIEEVAGMPIVDCQNTIALYYCANPKCTEEGAIIIYAHKPHDLEKSPKSTEATCTKDGTTIEVCKFVGCDYEKSTTVKALGHTPNFEATATIKDDKYVVKGTCTVETCKETVYESFEKKDGVASKEEPKCEAVGKDILTFTLSNGQKATYITEVPVKNHHFVDGSKDRVVAAKGNTLTPADVVYKWYDGCPLSATDDGAVNETTPVRMLYKCSDCGENVLVWVIKSTDAKYKDLPKAAAAN